MTLAVYFHAPLYYPNGPDSTWGVPRTYAIFYDDQQQIAVDAQQRLEYEEGYSAWIERHGIVYDHRQRAIQYRALYGEVSTLEVS